MSKRRHPKRRTTGERYAMLPDELLRHPAYTTLPHYARSVLVVIAAQYNGLNNGDLAITWATAKNYGIRSHNLMVQAIRALLDHRLIVKTKQGGKKPLGPCLYALTWHPIHERRGGYEFGICPCEATHIWLNWCPDGIGTARGPEKTNRRDRPRAGMGPPADQRRPISGPPADQKLPNIGTAGGPPSEISPGGHAVALMVVRA